MWAFEFMIYNPIFSATFILIYKPQQNTEVTYRKTTNNEKTKK